MGVIELLSIIRTYVHADFSSLLIHGFLAGTRILPMYLKELKIDLKKKNKPAKNNKKETTPITNIKQQ